MTHVHGIGVSGGIAIGPAVIAIQRTHVLRFTVAANQIDPEIAALERARERSRTQLQQIRARVAARSGSDLGSIFDAQLLMLDDPLLVQRAVDIIRADLANAEWAIHRAIDEIAAVLDGAADPYLSERKGDLHDVAGRLTMNLGEGSGDLRHLVARLDQPCVLVADELTPSVVAQIDWSRVSGFVTDAGSWTYHAAILARSLKVPAVVGLGDISLRVAPGSVVILNGWSGDVSIDPTPEEEDAARRLAPPASAIHAPSERTGPLRTRDGVAITMLLNIEGLEDLRAVHDLGADGVGLYRSECLLGSLATDPVTEEAHYQAYRQLVEASAGTEVTIRTFDVDEAEMSGAHARSDPARVTGAGGLRGIRAGLAHPDIFKMQMRAILRAAVHGPIRAMFPFVSTVEEVLIARRLVEEVRLDMGASRDLRVPLGVMIEVPAAALLAGPLSREADFFALGTNDLIQYTLAVDRTDERVSGRYQPLHPAVLRLIRLVHRAAAKRPIPLSVCGEMASDPLALQLLIGLGLRTFSMAPGAIDLASRVVQQADASHLATVAARVVRMGSASEIEQHLQQVLDRESLPVTTGVEE